MSQTTESTSNPSMPAETPGATPPDRESAVPLRREAITGARPARAFRRQMIAYSALLTVLGTLTGVSLSWLLWPERQVTVIRHAPAPVAPCMDAQRHAVREARVILIDSQAENQARGQEADQDVEVIELIDGQRVIEISNDGSRVSVLTAPVADAKVQAAPDPAPAPAADF